MVLLFVGCTPKAWLLEKRSDSGVIGYRSDLDDAQKEIELKKLIPCERFNIVSDQIKPKRVPIASFPLTMQNSHEMGEELGEQSPATGSLGSGKYSNNGASIPVDSNESMDATYGEAHYRCDSPPVEHRSDQRP